MAGILGATIASFFTGIFMCLKIQFNFNDHSATDNNGGQLIFLYLLMEHLFLSVFICAVGFIWNFLLWFFLSSYIPYVVEISCIILASISGIFVTRYISKFDNIILRMDTIFQEDPDLMQLFMQDYEQSVGTSGPFDFLQNVVRNYEEDATTRNRTDDNDNNNEMERRRRNVCVTGQHIKPQIAKEKLNQCKVCWENESTHVFNNCGHKCICVQCALIYDSQNENIFEKKCIICRKIYGKIIHIF